MADCEKLWGVRVLGIAADGGELCSDGSFGPAADRLEGASCHLAQSTADTMEIVSDLSRRPQVAVVDLGSRSDDFDVCELASQLSKGFSIPVLFAMGRSDLAHMNEAIAAQPAGYLHKPVTAETLGSAIADLVPERSRPAPQPEPAPMPDAARVGAEAPASSERGGIGAAVAAPPLPPSTPLAPAPTTKVESAEAAANQESPVISKLRAPTAVAPTDDLVLDEFEPDQQPSGQSSPLESQSLSSGGEAALSQAATQLHGAGGSMAGENWQREIRGQQLQGLGLLGRGFAHEFNNLLTVLVGNLSLAQDRYESGKNAATDSELATAQKAADRARRMVQQLLTFAEGGRPVRDSVRIADVARSILMPHRKAYPAIRFQFQCTEPDLRVSVDRDQVARLLENLVTNAVQAMAGDGGTLIVRLFTATDAEIDRIRPGAGQSGLEYLLIEVIDTGIGMDEETLKHAFDPYFTTRSEINATGIGLTVCESIAKAHGGFLALQSKPGRGTIATFHLPMNAATARPDIFEMRAEDGEGIPGLFATVADEVVKEAEGEETPGAAIADENGDFDEFVEAGQGRRVLVMEDDPMIRRLVARCLGRAGYDVAETTNGQDALDAHDLAREEGRPFELILSDLTIEDGMGGIEMMKQLRQRDPDIAAIVSSGYADSPAMAAPSEYGFDAVLPKPYPPRELLRLVAVTLAE